MKFTYLGSGNAFAPQRNWSCILVNDSLLLDAGPSALASLKRLSLDPARITHIFISHFHGDHFLGLPFLLLEYAFLSRTDAPLTIIGPPGIEERLRQIMILAFPEVMERSWPRPTTFVEAQSGAKVTANGVTFMPVMMNHLPRVLQAFGYRLYLPDGIVAYTGDTGMTDALSTLFAGARVCIVEAASQETSPVHLGRADLATLLQRLPEDTLVMLTHLDTPDASPWRDFNVIIPQDDDTYEFAFPLGPNATETDEDASAGFRAKD